MVCLDKNQAPTIEESPEETQSEEMKMKLKLDPKKVRREYNRNHHRKRTRVRIKNAQSALAQAIREGRIKREPCALCGLPNAEGHHVRYAHSLKVVFLCKRHHASVGQLKKSGVPYSRVLQWWKKYKAAIYAPSKEFMFIIRNRKILANNRKANNESNNNQE